MDLGLEHMMEISVELEIKLLTLNLDLLLKEGIRSVTPQVLVTMILLDTSTLEVKEEDTHLVRKFLSRGLKMFLGLDSIECLLELLTFQNML